MFKFLKKRINNTKERYKALKGDGMKMAKDIKSNINADKESYKALKDSPETEGVAKLRRYKNRLTPYAIALAIVITLNGYFGISLTIGESMSPSIENRQLLVIDKKADIERGDVIVFSDKDKFPNLQTVVKRVIALPGERIKCVNGNVYIDGKIIEQPYRWHSKTDDFNEITVPEGEVFVMGDNREHSTDSRNVGTIKLVNVIGRVIGQGTNERNYQKELDELNGKIFNDLSSKWGN